MKKYLLKIYVYNDIYTVCSLIINEEIANKIKMASKNIDEDFYVFSDDFALEYYNDGISSFELYELEDIEAYVLQKFEYINLENNDEDILETTNKSFAMKFVEELLMKYL